jgi:hypothetical protein
MMVTLRRSGTLTAIKNTLQVNLRALNNRASPKIKLVSEASGALPPGAVYQGEMRDGLPHGHGEITLKSGFVYTGSFVLSQREGIGTCLFPDGSVYEGEWRASKKHGQGKLTTSHGDLYEGSWVDGFMDGKGKYAVYLGNRYEGDWVKNKKHGWGVCRFAQTYQEEESGIVRVYEGEYRANKCHGKGRMVVYKCDKKGVEEEIISVIYDGMWTDGQPADGVL